MDEQTARLLLEEFREFRRDIAAWQQETGERIATLEAQVKDVVGNGQPGRLTIVERAVYTLQQWRWWQIGAAAGVSCAVSAVAWAIVHLAH